MSKFSVQKELVSVCIVTYNHENYIQRCLDSILNQSVNFSFEIIVSDDASTDKTQEILKKYENMGRVFVNCLKNNVGPYENYRIAHGIAKGKYIAHCDGDDYWLPGKLQAQVDFLEHNDMCSAVYSNAIVIDASNEEAIGLFNDKVSEKFDVNYLMEKLNFLNHSSMMYRSKLRESIIPRMSPFIDYMIHLSLSKFGTLGYINENYVAYRMNVKGSLVTEQHSRIEGLVIDTVNMAWPALNAETHEKIKNLYFLKSFKALVKLRYQYCLYYWRAIPCNNISLSRLHFLYYEVASYIFNKIKKKYNGGNIRKIFFPRESEW